ncbi:MAG: DUF4382 domain-containing protein [Armatimonadetes bacterium]|nr:DUF4382 domain-containing protein [Armatimonadota bacterium]
MEEMTIKKLIAFAAILTALLIAGCGGSSGGGSAGSLSLFLTDDLSTNYDGVWVTVYEADIVRADNSKVRLFESASGMPVNLRALNNGTAQYLFAGSVTAPSGTFTKLVFHVSKDLTLYPTGATTGQAATFIDSLDSSTAGQSELVVPFSPAVTFAAGDKIAADFKLDQWTLASGKVTPVVAKGNGVGLEDHNRHVEGEMRGLVSDLSGTAPAQTFSLGTFGGTVSVVTDANTVFVGRAAGVSPTLANGQTVEVRASYNPTTKNFTAKSVHIEDGNTPDDQGAKGLATNINSGAGTFDLTPGRTKGFVPAKLPVGVLTSTSTRFISASGVSMTQGEFFVALTALGSSAVAQAEGTYDSGTGVLTATKVKIDDESHEGEAEAKGTVASTDAGAGTLHLTLSEWEGFNFDSANQLVVTTDGTTQYSDDAGATLTKEAFFTAAAVGSLVKAEGHFSANGLAAKKLQVRSSTGGGGGGGDHPADAKGYISQINSGAKTFHIKLVDWFGFEGSLNGDVAVTMAGNATYRKKDGTSVSAADFFALLSDNTVVDVEGTYAGGVLTGTKAKIDD